MPVAPAAASTSISTLVVPPIKDNINSIRGHSRNDNTGGAFEQTAEALAKLGPFLGQLASQVNSISGGGSGTSTSTYYDGGSGTTFTPNYANGSTQVFTLTGNATINAVTGVLPGQEFILVLVQDATGGRQVTSWDASYLIPGVFGLDPTPATATVFRFIGNAVSHVFLTATPITQVPWP